MINEIDLNCQRLLKYRFNESKKIRINLGDEFDGKERVSEALKRSKMIFSTVFENKECWIKLVLWDCEFSKTIINIKNCGFDYDSFEKFIISEPVGYEGYDMNDTEVVYFKISRFNFTIIIPLLTAIFNYELAIEPSANINAMFFNLTDNILVYPYDDRGVDLVGNENILNKLKDNFIDWIN